MYWSSLLPEVPYLLLAFLIPLAAFRLQLGPRARAMVLNEMELGLVLRLTFRAWFWTSDKVMFWLPPMGAVFERWDQESAEASRARQSASSASPRHSHDMRLMWRGSVVRAVCGCGLNVPVKPPRHARRNVAALQRWLDRLDRRLGQDS